VRIPLRICVLAGVIAVLTSCSGNAPTIDELQWRILLRDDGRQRYEELAIHVRLSDADADDDPVLLSLSAGRTGLIWRFPREDWRMDTLEGTDWIGLPSAIPLEGSRLPQTLYTLRVEDLAGRSDEITFRPDPDRLDPEGISWPSARLESGRLVLEGGDGPATVILRDIDGTPVATVSAIDGTAIGDESAATWELWIDRPERSQGFRLGPYPLSGLPGE